MAPITFVILSSFLFTFLLYGTAGHSTGMIGRLSLKQNRKDEDYGLLLLYWKKNLPETVRYPHALADIRNTYSANLVVKLGIHIFQRLPQFLRFQGEIRCFKTEDHKACGPELFSGCFFVKGRDKKVKKSRICYK